jgi:phosphoglycolate phosphatase-like HAD superfamily hydrolase
MGRGDGNDRLPRAVIFDFDGVILESVDIKTEAFLFLFADHPEHGEAIRRYHLENLGISRYLKFEWIYSELLGRAISEEEIRQLGETFSEIVLEKVLACPFVPGAMKLLETLHNRSLLFIASGTPQEELERVVDARNLRQFFTEVWGSPRGKVEIIRSILSRFGLSEEDVFFVGDGLSDYRAAVETGVGFIARDTAQGVDWKALGAPTVPDLTAAHSYFGLQQLIESS